MREVEVTISGLPPPVMELCCRCKHNQGWGQNMIAYRRSLGLVFMLTVAGVSRSAGVTECSRAAPYFLSTDQRIALCRHANSSAPADCARKAHTAPGLQGSLILDLCSGVSSDMPGSCVAGLSRSTAKSLSPDLRVDLCRDALSDAPAQCVERSIKSKQQPQLAVDVCRGASGIAPAECLDMLPRGIYHNAAVHVCSRVQTVGPAVCTNVQGQLRYGIEVTARLCRGARGRGPAECFRRAALATKLSTDDRVELCNGAESDAPARCAGDVRDRRLGSSERITLCHKASSTAPAACVASVPPTVPPGDRVGLCTGAIESSPIAPAACFKAIPQDVPISSAVALCRGASDSTAAECAKVARHVVGNSDFLIELCGEASSTTPAHCAKAAFHAGADKHHAAVLCARSTSLLPASCFAEAPHQISADLRVESCAGAISIGPARCLAAAMPRGLRGQDGGATCPLDPQGVSVPRRGLDHRLAARLCKNAADDGAAECGRAAPFSMSDKDVEVLCEAKGRPDREATPRCAISALMAGISSSNSAALCRGASSDAPASCVAAVAPRIEERKRVAVCVRASSSAPARCVNSLSAVRTPSATEITQCVEAVPRPSGLRITSLGYDGEVLFPDQPIHATLEIQDQWGGGIPFDSSTVVRASVALRGSNGAVVNANGRFNTSSDGVVHFSHLSFSGPGNVTLQFSIDGRGVGNVPLASAQVIVMETEHSAITRRCGRIFSVLACPSGNGRDQEALARGSYFSTEVASIVSGGTAVVWYVLTCQNVLEENGVYVAYISGSTSALSAWLWYHPGMEALETGAGLPTRDQAAWEKLGVKRDASPREVRRAYYRQSLLWHPDRWVRHSMHSARAQEVFEIVGEAYAWMTREADGKPRPHLDAVGHTG